MFFGSSINIYTFSYFFDLKNLMFEQNKVININLEYFMYDFKDYNQIFYLFTKNKDFNYLIMFNNFYNIDIYMLFLLKNIINIRYSLAEICGKKLNNKLNLFYNFFSITLDNRLICMLDNNTNYVKSLTSICLNACWLEREISEFLNLYVLNLVDTRRLLTDYSFQKYSLVTTSPSVHYNNIYWDLN